MSAQGTATVDFGATPAEEATVSIATSGLLSTSEIEAWFQQGDTTADNGADEHDQAAALCRLAAAYVSGTQFDVKAMPLAMTGIGTFKFHWAWV